MSFNSGFNFNPCALLHPIFSISSLFPIPIPNPPAAVPTLPLHRHHILINIIAGGEHKFPTRRRPIAQREQLLLAEHGRQDRLSYTYYMHTPPASMCVNGLARM